MSIVIDGTLGVSLVQDGVVSESKIVSGAVTDTKLTLTPNSQEIKDALNATGSAPIYACRAWVNFNGTGTVAIRASGNVTSITDNGVGDYRVNFTTAMSDTNYSVISSCDTFVTSKNISVRVVPQTALSVAIQPIDSGGVQVDSTTVNVAIFR